MARAFEQSHTAYARKDGAAAKELSNEGKAHQREMERLNAEASAWIFRGEYRSVPLLSPPLFQHATPSSFVENNRVRILLVLAKCFPGLTFLLRVLGQNANGGRFARALCQGGDYVH